MPYRYTPFVDSQIYHIYNRGSEKRLIFESLRDYQRFIKTLTYYQIENPKPRFSIYSPKFHTIDSSKLIVEILGYCLMPNHFHLLIKQLRNGGTSEYIRKVSNSYTKFFNIKYNRVGPLFQGQFKAVLIENDEQLMHVSRYIHLNPLTSYLVKNLEQYKWSSYSEYLGFSRYEICQKKQILDYFKSPQKYEQFVLDQAAYAQELELIKHKLIEELL